MNVVWHHDIFVDANVIVLGIKLPYILVHNFTNSGQFYLRDVVNTIPYDLAKQFLFAFGADRHEIISLLAVTLLFTACGGKTDNQHTDTTPATGENENTGGIGGN